MCTKAQWPCCITFLVLSTQFRVATKDYLFYLFIIISERSEKSRKCPHKLPEPKIIFNFVLVDQKSKTQWYKMYSGIKQRKSSKCSHLKSWNPQMFEIRVFKFSLPKSN